MLNPLKPIAAPRFAGAYFSENTAKEKSADEDKLVMPLMYNQDVFFINNDAKGHDLSRFHELTRFMFQYDYDIRTDQQDRHMPRRDWELLNMLLRALHAKALQNWTDETGEVD